MLVFFTGLCAYFIATSRAAKVFRLIETNEPPLLPLASGHVYHLFLSHIWGSGQDQVAVVKRQLQLYLPGVCVFLDIDDLDDIGGLDDMLSVPRLDRHVHTSRQTGQN